MLSVVIPTLNAASALPSTLEALKTGIGAGLETEIIVVDGGSSDATLAIAEAFGCRTLRRGAGRGSQLRAGCAAARLEWILTLHADTRLEAGWREAALNHIRRHPQAAGYFELRFDDPSRIARVWESGVDLRNRLFALPYGDQGLLVSKALYSEIGGYPDWPLFEDVEIVARLGRRRLRRLEASAATSSEKYQRDGWVQRSIANAILYGRWRLGEDPSKLRNDYR